MRWSDSQRVTANKKSAEFCKGWRVLAVVRDENSMRNIYFVGRKGMELRGMGIDSFLVVGGSCSCRAEG